MASERETRQVSTGQVVDVTHESEEQLFEYNY
jgi:hypothetical protein